MARLTKEEQQRIQEIENEKLLSRNMIFYTHLEQYTEDAAIEDLIKKSWELRIENRDSRNNLSYEKEIRNYLIGKYEFIEKRYPSIDNILNYDWEKINSKNLEYFLFLLSTIFQSNFVHELSINTIYARNSVCFEYATERIREYFKEKIQDKCSILEIMIRQLQNNDLNDLALSLKFQDLIDENILDILEEYKDYTLVENGNFFSENKLYLQIDLYQSDDEILKSLKKIRTKLNILRDYNITNPRKITKTQEHGNILFIYDCLELGLRKDYIVKQIREYFTEKNIPFSVSNNVYNNYITQIEKYLNN